MDGSESEEEEVIDNVFVEQEKKRDVCCKIGLLIFRSSDVLVYRKKMVMFTAEELCRIMDL